MGLVQAADDGVDELDASDEVADRDSERKRHGCKNVILSV
jgi:hypothetical protein